MANILSLSLFCWCNVSAAAEYLIVPGDSELRVLVFRAGSLAGLGHNHVISSRALSGTVKSGDTVAERAIDIRLPVDSLTVDDPAIRAEEGQSFSSKTSEKDAQGTRRNIMGRKLLQAEQFDEIRVFSKRISGDLPDVVIEAEITLKGAAHSVELPAIVETYDDRLVATGTTSIAHSELGLEPFTAAFGTMRVAQEMIFKYRIVARKTDVDAR
jgi:polyisoprenoid-binding protein YceI